MIPEPAQTADETKPPAHYRVVLVEDQSETRESWSRLISSLPEFTCICTYTNAEDALLHIPDVNADVILMDVFLPGMSGIECTARLKAIKPGIPIIMLTASDEDEILFKALQSGADGYLLKRTKPGDLRAALLDVLNGGAPMSSEIARHVIESFREKGPVADESQALSAREKETLVLLTKGYANKEIAERLKISVEAIRSRLKRIYEKLHVRSRSEAVAHYMAKRRR